MVAGTEVKHGIADAAHAGVTNLKVSGDGSIRHARAKGGSDVGRGRKGHRGDHDLSRALDFLHNGPVREIWIAVDDHTRVEAGGTADIHKLAHIKRGGLSRGTGRNDRNVELIAVDDSCDHGAIRNPRMAGDGHAHVEVVRVTSAEHDPGTAIRRAGIELLHVHACGHIRSLGHLRQHQLWVVSVAEAAVKDGCETGVGVGLPTDVIHPTGSGDLHAACTGGRILGDGTDHVEPRSLTTPVHIDLKVAAQQHGCADHVGGVVRVVRLNLAQQGMTIDAVIEVQTAACSLTDFKMVGAVRVADRHDARDFCPIQSDVTRRGIDIGGDGDNAADRIRRRNRPPVARIRPGAAPLEIPGVQQHGNLTRARYDSQNTVFIEETDVINEVPRQGRQDQITTAITAVAVVGARVEG